MVEPANVFFAHKDLGHRMYGLTNGFFQIRLADAFLDHVHVAVGNIPDLAKLPGAHTKTAGCTTVDGDMIHKLTPVRNNGRPCVSCCSRRQAVPYGGTPNEKIKLMN
eukprot:TRINITY_DN3276_c0_g3_i1.p1 TRINITY_DN3276_c0_g3~~TRINITY_DN3276_c0_g3_i1.p1  ORF type:complete len:107 (-),score=2.09 TRINITY_DN3276_c0_g3_i1:305-625(-)